MVAELQLAAAEELSVGGIDEVFGQAAEGLLGGGSQRVHKDEDAVFAVFRGR